MTDHTLGEAGGLLRDGFRTTQDRAAKRQLRRALPFLEGSDDPGTSRVRGYAADD
jgi:hypothetical protein